MLKKSWACDSIVTEKAKQGINKFYWLKTDKMISHQSLSPDWAQALLWTGF